MASLGQHKSGLECFNFNILGFIFRKMTVRVWSFGGYLFLVTSKLGYFFGSFLKSIVLGVFKPSLKCLVFLQFLLNWTYVCL